MLISLRSLIDRARHPASRARELELLRARFAAQPSRREAGDRAARLAEEALHHKIELAKAIGEVEACKGCAAKHPAPEGRWPGGFCCGGKTLEIFSAPQVAALKLAGTKASRLRAPPGDHAGCAFRGEKGCSLAVEDRPAICVRYVCLELRSELRDSSRWKRIAESSKALDVAYQGVCEALSDDA